MLSDNLLTWDEINSMSKAEILEAYKENMHFRGRGRNFNIELFKSWAQLMDLTLPMVPEDHTIFENIAQVDTPESSSLEGYGYNYYDHILYVKYRTGDKVYAYPDIYLDRFSQFEASKSKGEEAALLRKEFGNRDAYAN